MKKTINGLKYALNGLKMVSLEGRNFQISLVAASLVIIVGLALDVTKTEMMFLIVACVFVLASEAINTAIEDLCNIVGPNPDPLIGEVKDISAGFVLISVFGSIAIGIIVFLPYLLAYFR